MAGPCRCAGPCWQPRCCATAEGASGRRPPVGCHAVRARAQGHHRHRCAGVDVPLSEVGKLSKQQPKLRLGTMVVGKTRSPEVFGSLEKVSGLQTVRVWKLVRVWKPCAAAHRSQA